MSFTLGVTSVDNYYLLRTAASVPSSSCELSYLRSNSCATILLQNFPTHWLSWYLLKMEETTTREHQFGHHYSSPAVQIPFLFQNTLSSSPHTPHYYFLKQHRLQLISCLQVPASLRPWENKESRHHLEPVKMRQSKVLPACWWQLQHQEWDHLFCMVAVQDPHLRKGARLLAKEEVQSQLVATERKKERNCLPNLGPVLSWFKVKQNQFSVQFQWPVRPKSRQVQKSIMAAAAKSGFQNKKRVTY